MMDRAEMPAAHAAESAAAAKPFAQIRVLTTADVAEGAMGHELVQGELSKLAPAADTGTSRGGDRPFALEPWGIS